MPFMACLDSSIVNVALPVMAKRLSASMASIEQVVTSYLIVISATILFFGRLGDIKGKTNVFKYGFILFSLGSLLCGISVNLKFLVISRIVQGIGAAMTMATSQGIITHVFPSNERGRALGISATFVALGTLVGPPLGGYLITYFSWQYIFLINVPIGVIAFIFALKFLPKGEINEKQSLDIKGALLFSFFIVLLFWALITGQRTGYDAKVNLGLLAALLSFLLFIIVEKKTENPMVDLSIFKNSVFSINVFCAFVSFLGISSVNIIQPFYLQYVLKITPAKSGTILMVYPVILSIVAPLSGYLSDKIGSKILTLTGLAITTIGLFSLTRLWQGSRISYIVFVIALLGLGNGLFQSPNNSLVMSSVPKNKLGIAGGINALIRNLGFVFGVSLSTSILYNRMSYKIGYKVLSYVEGREDAFVYGMKYVYYTTAIICVVGFLTSLYSKIERVKNN